MAVIPSSNVKLASDIGQVLNDYGGSVDANQPLTFFTEAAKINKLSKHKPVPYSKPFCQDFDSTRDDYDATWWKGNDGMCGLDIPTTSVMVSSSSSDGVWVHNLPNGGENEPFRLSDFANYATFDVASNPDLSLPRPTLIRINDETSTFDVTLGSGDNSRIAVVDIFDKLCMSICAEGNSVIFTSEISTSNGYNQSFSFTSSDKAQLGAVEGGFVNYHFYGKMTDGSLRSLRFDNSTVTVDKMRVFSNEPYVARLSVGSAKSDGSNYYIYDINAILDASYCAGYTPPGQPSNNPLYNSGILVYPYVGDDYDYLNNGTTIQSVMITENIGVEEGNVLEYIVAEQLYIDGLNIPNTGSSLTKFMILWVTLSSEVLAKLSVDIT